MNQTSPRRSPTGEARRMRPVRAVAAAALCAGLLCGAIVPPARAASARDVSICFGAYSMASAYGAQMTQLPSARQRFISAAMAARTWTQAAALCPAVVFPSATVNSAVAAYRAQRLASAAGFESLDLTTLGYTSDSAALLEAVRETCGYDAAQTAGDSGAALHTGADGGATDAVTDAGDASRRAACAADPRGQIGLEASEMGAVALAEDRAGYIATTLYARLHDDQYSGAASHLLKLGNDFAGMLEAANQPDTRAGVYSTALLRTMDGQPLSDPLTGLAMPVLTAVSYDAAAESLIGMSSASGDTGDAADDSGTDADGAAEDGSSSDGGYITLTERDLTGESGGQATDPTVTLATPLARRRAASAILASQLLEAFDGGAPAMTGFLIPSER